MTPLKCSNSDVKQVNHVTSNLHFYICPTCKIAFKALMFSNLQWLKSFEKVIRMISVTFWSKIFQVGCKIFKESVRIFGLN